MRKPRNQKRTISTSIKKVAAASALTVALLSQDVAQEPTGSSFSLLPQVAALETKTEAKVEAKAESKAESKIQSKTESKSETKQKAKVETEASILAEAEALVKSKQTSKSKGKDSGMGSSGSF